MPGGECSGPAPQLGGHHIHLAATIGGGFTSAIGHKTHGTHGT